MTDLVVSEDHGKVEGVVAFDTHKGETHAIHARNVLMATGGAGRLFHTTSNSWDLTGDGMALTLSAGLQLEDSEFVQFHPTGLAHTGILLSEAGTCGRRRAARLRWRGVHGTLRAGACRPCRA